MITLLLIPLFAFGSLSEGDSIAKKPCCVQHCKSHKASRTDTPVGEGPYTVNPKTVKPKKDVQEIHYHNEQDNFKPADSVKYRPAPLGRDTLDGHSYLDFLEQQKSFKTAANPAVAFGFNAEAIANNTPPDNALAISNGGAIISATNGGIFFYNSSGQSQGTVDYASFFNAPTSNFSDPRLIYDQYSDKFIFFIQYGSSSTDSRLYVAFSTSNDPTQLWNYYVFDVGNTGGLVPGNWFDYPSVGINQTDFCFTGNIFSNAGSFVTNIVMLIDKQDGYNGVSFQNLNYIYWTDVKDGNNSTGFTIAPAGAAQSITYSNTFHLVSTTSGGSNYVTKYTITGNAKNLNSTLARTKITTQPYSPSSTASQPGGVQLANYKAGCRTQHAIFINNTICFVYSANFNTGGFDYNSIYYNRINVSNNTIEQNWSFLSGSNYNYPSLASFGNNQSDRAVMICFMKTDANTFPEIRFKYFDDNMNQLASEQARGGDSYVQYTWTNEQRWGDYSAIQRRFNASQPEAWLAGSFGNSGRVWQTYIAKISGYPGNVSVAEVNLDLSELQYYPNPVENQLYIKGDFKKYYGFPALYTIEGKLLPIDVTRKGDEMFQIDVDKLVAGNYLVKFSDKRTLKFTKK